MLLASSGGSGDYFRMADHPGVERMNCFKGRSTRAGFSMVCS